MKNLCKNKSNSFSLGEKKMKNLSKFASLFAMLLIALGAVACKQEPEPTPVDTTAPAEVTKLKAEAKDSRVLLTWTDANDDDIFGYEVSYSGTSAINRAVTALEKTSMIVPHGAGGTYISGLENGTEYTFTVKTMDTSGNKSDGVTAKATPEAVDASETLKIALSASVPTSNAYTTNYTGNKSNTTVTVSVNIMSASTVKKVVYKKDGSLIAKTLLADTEAKDATKDTSDDKKWTFEISATDETANGTYTVAAIDEAGREEAEQIEIDQFDFTGPAKVKRISGKYTSENSCIILNWTEPSDEDFDKIEITYSSSDDGLNYSTPSEPESVLKGTEEKTFNNIDGDKASYKFSFVSIDKLGNRSNAKIYVVDVNKGAKKLPEGFVLVDGASFDGTETWTPSSSVFVSGRAITIRDLLVSDHEVTQGEYETYCKYGSSSPSDSYGKGDDFPAYYVNWYDAIVYCNLRSIAENLEPVYKLGEEEESDPKNWDGIISTDGKYCGPSNSNSQWDAITMDIEANGYRLPTEAEWEYLARGGETTSTTYSGSDNIDDVAWYYDNSNRTHEVKGKKPNALGLYDMSGNVWEWCWDWYDWYDITSSTPETGAASGSYRCLRGGGWDDNASFCSVSYRYYYYPYFRFSSRGFRVVRSSSN